MDQLYLGEQERVGRTTIHSKPRDAVSIDLILPAQFDILSLQVKPLTIKQHALSSMLHVASRTPSPKPRIVTHDQEQVKLRSETISAFHHAVDQDNADEGLFVLREKTKDEVEREEEEYQEYLKREVGVDIRDLVTIEDDSIAIMKQHEDDEEIGETLPITKKKSNKGKEKEKRETDQEFLMK